MRCLVSISSVLVALSLGAGARAREPKAAIAPLPLGSSTPPELIRAFQDELPRALRAAGFSLVPPAQVDMKVMERPELVHCTAGGCLVEEASFFQVGRLVLPRLEAPSGGDYTVGLSLFDAEQGQSIADGVERCSGCTPARLRQTVRAAAGDLRQAATRPGALSITTSRPVRLAVDGQSVGMTPWQGPLAPGDHVVVLEAAGGQVERDVSVAPGRTARLDLRLDLTETAPARPRFRVVKWVALAAGLAAAGVGAGLWAIDGQPTCSLSGTARECPKLYDTLAAGAALVGVGGALVITSVVMLALDARHSH